MADFKPGELARVRESHHKVAPRGSIVRVIEDYYGYNDKSRFYHRDNWIKFEPLIKRGAKEEYTWEKRKFEKI